MCFMNNSRMGDTELAVALPDEAYRSQRLDSSDCERTGQGPGETLIKLPEAAHQEGSIAKSSRRALFYFPGCFMGRSDGCHIRAMQTIDLLVASGLDVVIYSYRRHSMWPWSAADETACAQRFPTARLVLDEGGVILHQSGRARTLLSLLGSRFRDWGLRLRVPGLTPALDALKSEGPISVVVVNNATGITHLNGLPDSTIIVDEHDVTALEQMRDHQAGAFKGLLALRKELGLLAAADAIWCISYAEHIFLREVLNSARIRFVPPTICQQATPTAISAPRYDLLFVGSDNRWNADALLAFFAQFAGWKNRYSLAVAGKVSLNPRVRARSADIGGVTLLGFCDDLDSLYQTSRATICPVEGTGTKIKIIESLAAARPVFAARGAMRGLAPGHEGCVFGLDEQFVHAILSEPAAMQRAQAAAATYAGAYNLASVLRTVRQDLGGDSPAVTGVDGTQRLVR